MRDFENPVMKRKQFTGFASCPLRINGDGHLILRNQFRGFLYCFDGKLADFDVIDT